MEELRQYIQSLSKEGICIAFSGGVDSSLLLKIASETGGVVHAVTFDTRLHPKADLALAKQIADEVGVVHKTMSLDEFEIVELIENPPQRCYFCKKHLFTELQTYASNHSLKHIIDGTNFNDLSEYRPGLKALAELQIISPLAELKITKEQIRNYAKSLGLSVHNRPSAPCLATRMPYYTKLDMDVLERINTAEEFLRELGFAINRVRLHDNIVRIEVPVIEFQNLINMYQQIVTAFKQLGFQYITMDMAGFRSGSMDEVDNIKL